MLCLYSILQVFYDDTGYIMSDRCSSIQSRSSRKCFQISMKFVLSVWVIFSMFTTTTALRHISLSRKVPCLQATTLYRSLHALDAGNAESDHQKSTKKKKKATASLSTLPTVGNSQQQLSFDNESLPSGGQVESPNGASIATNENVFFVVNGEPTCLQRHRVLRSGISYNPSSKQQKAFLDSSRPFLPSQPLEGPLEMRLDFYFKRPLNHYGTGKNSNILKPGMDIWHSKRKG